ncbi:MAG TPA: UDP-N-acetylglucosamine diphosphorylase/glucosamine-1-phosphate N-acetyltransferase [Elusimicrobia bacterium]|nr:MAG: UDP-N-acetylglucosamine diphosphorylase/glucosamine-1-phosphate N-acetyltransferase [Elusimicrobia bacterium GWA2_66_18]HAZ09285.1 UDP-N-acetylglucosamine diphosphorylase/glucosamine-1-phosphate N-acetyltransferase [Elusimicrobiota bacterium]
MNNAKKAKGQLAVLILAAGQGMRMESSIPKVLHHVGGRPMLFYILRIANALKPGAIGVVVGHESDQVKAATLEMARSVGITRAICFITQKKPLGSGNAVVESLPFLKKFKTAAVMCGDTPLLTYESIYNLLLTHDQLKGQATLLTARIANPKGYGRIIRGALGEVQRVVEESVATSKEAAVNEVNSGAYVFELEALISGLKKIGAKGPKKEHFLTDVMEAIRAKGGRIHAYATSNADEIQGINNRFQLSISERVLNKRMLERLMISGVTIRDPQTTQVDADVEIGQDTVIYPGTILRGHTKIGRLCRLGPFTHIENSLIGNECEVRYSYVVGARLLEKTSVGPFAHIRPDSIIGPRARIGNFTEVKASKIGFGSKVNHLSYIGDADIAEDVNIGAGAITCNYDGREKHQTTIGAKAFIGSNVNLIAPVRIGRGAKVAAGSTVTEDVPDEALAIARARQVNKT